MHLTNDEVDRPCSRYNLPFRYLRFASLSPVSITVCHIYIPLISHFTVSLLEAVCHSRFPLSSGAIFWKNLFHTLFCLFSFCGACFLLLLCCFVFCFRTFSRSSPLLSPLSAWIVITSRSFDRFVTLSAVSFVLHITFYQSFSFLRFLVLRFPVSRLVCILVFFFCTVFVLFHVVSACVYTCLHATCILSVSSPLVFVPLWRWRLDLTGVHACSFVHVLISVLFPSAFSHILFVPHTYHTVIKSVRFLHVCFFVLHFVLSLVCLGRLIEAIQSVLFSHHYLSASHLSSFSVSRGETSFTTMGSDRSESGRYHSLCHYQPHYLPSISFTHFAILHHFLTPLPPAACLLLTSSPSLFLLHDLILREQAHFTLMLFELITCRSFRFSSVTGATGLRAICLGRQLLAVCQYAW